MKTMKTSTYMKKRLLTDVDNEMTKKLEISDDIKLVLIK